jgi:phage terminase large subunit-like protein
MPRARAAGPAASRQQLRSGTGSSAWSGDLGERAVRFFNNLTHTGDYAGEPFKLRPWQEAPIRQLFGTLRPDGTRQYRTTFWAFPRKQGKTEVVAGGGLYLMMGQGRPNQRIYTAAGDAKQASLIFKAACDMIRADPELEDRTVIYEGYKRIDFPAGDSSLEVLSSVPKSKHGLGPTGVLIDEMHCVEEELVNVLTTGFGARRDPLTWYITTAGWNRHSICFDEWQYAIQVRDGIVDDPTYLPVIYAADPEDDWREEATWRKAMPALGDFCSIDFIRDECRKAIERPRFENTFRQLYLNQWCVTMHTMFWQSSGLRVGVEDLAVGDSIVGFDETTRGLVTAKVQAITPMEPSVIYKITTARGRTIRVNGHHPFWVREGQAASPRYGWKQADQLAVGSRIGVALGHPKLPRGSLRLDADSCRFLGMMLGDGTLVGGPELTTIDPEIAEFFGGFVRRLGDEPAVKNDGVHHYPRNSEGRGLKQTRTKQWLKARGVWGMRVRTKRVPACVWKSGVAGWSAFLSGYLDTDGHVGKSSIVYVSAHRDLLVDCQDMLAYLGVQSSIRQAGPRYRLEVLDAESFRLCQKLLKLVVPRKQAALGSLPTEIGRDMSDRRAFDRVVSIELEPEQPTYGVTIQGIHTHVTNGLITHNTEQATRWLSLEAWDACRAEIDWSRYEGRECWGGLDLSTSQDLTALVLAFPNDLGGVDLMPIFWLPGESAEERFRKDRVPYPSWVRAGHIRMTDGERLDYTVVEETLREVHSRFRLVSLAYDPAHSRLLADRLYADGNGLPMLALPNTFVNLNEPSRTFERLIVERKIRHDGNPVLRWCVSNVCLAEKGGLILPSKGKSTERIDGVAGSVMALCALGRLPEPAESVYEQRGLVLL